MASVGLDIHIEASASKVWQVLLGAEREKFITTVFAEKVEFDGHGEGQVATYTLKNGAGIVREQIEYLDNDQRCVKYRVIDRGPLPYEDYQGELNVTENGSDACDISIRVTYIPVGMKEKDSNQFWLDQNNGFMLGLKTYLGVC